MLTLIIAICLQVILNELWTYNFTYNPYNIS